VARGYRISKKKRYAKTVKRGDSPFTVWTIETGILEVAVELRRWPPIWKAASGKVVFITSLEGARIECFRAGIDVRNLGNMLASHEDIIQ
jgi:hypothetical protein